MAGPHRRRRKRVAHRLEWVGFRFLTGVIRALPRAAALRVGTALGSFAFDWIRVRRAVAIENVMAHLAPRGGLSEAERIARESYRIMGRTFMDLLRIDLLDDGTLWRLLPRDEFAPAHGVLAPGGGLLVSGHFGNWELLALAIRRVDVKLHAMARDQSNRRVGTFLNTIRADAGIPTMSARRGLRHASRVLGRRECLCTLIDQDGGKRGVFSSFLGTPASTPAGVIGLAIDAGLPMFAGVLVDEGGEYRFVYADPWLPDQEKSRDDNLRDGVAHFNGFLEQQVRAHPENYFWAHRRWKTPAP